MIWKNKPFKIIDHGGPIGYQDWQEYLANGAWEYITTNGKNRTTVCKLWNDAVYEEKLKPINSLIELYCK